MADISLTLDIAGGGDEPYASGIVKVRRNIPGVGSGGYVDGSYHAIPLSNPPTVLGANGFDPLEQGTVYDFLLPGMSTPISLQMPNTSTASFSDLAPIIPPIPIPDLVDGPIADLITSGSSQTNAAVLQVAARLRQWAKVPESIVTGAITRNGDGAATSFTVRWPDGKAGTYTADTLSSTSPGAVDGYHVTYGSPVVLTFTQPTVTRDGTGAVSNTPEMVVS